MFALLHSSMWNAWMRTVSGRLKSDFSFSPGIATTLPFPRLDDKAKSALTDAAARSRCTRCPPDATLADLYDPIAMPSDLVAVTANLTELWTGSIHHARSSRATPTGWVLSSSDTRSSLLHCCISHYQQAQATVGARPVRFIAAVLGRGKAPVPNKECRPVSSERIVEGCTPTGPASEESLVEKNTVVTHADARLWSRLVREG